MRANALPHAEMGSNYPFRHAFSHASASAALADESPWRHSCSRKVVVWEKILTIVAKSDPSKSIIGPIVGALAAVAIWGASPFATAIAGRSIPPELIAGLRTMLAGVILLPLVVRYRHDFPGDWPGRAELIIGAMFGFAIYPLMLSVGVLKTSVTHASIILAAAPIFTGLLTFSITREWPKTLWWIGSLVAIGGVATLMAWRGSAQIGTPATVWGDTLVLLSVLCASVGYVYGGRSAARIGQWPATAWSIVIGAFVFAPFVFPKAIRFDWATTVPSHVLALVFLVVFVTVIQLVQYQRRPPCKPIVLA